MRCLGACLVVLATGCGQGGDCNPLTALTEVAVTVTEPDGTPLDDASVECNDTPCDPLGADGAYDCGAVQEGPVEVLALHPMWGSVVERTEVVPCDTPSLDVELALEPPMGL